MKKTLIIILIAILAISLFISCEGDLDSELEAKITVSFDGNKSTGGKMDALQVKKGEEFKLTKNAFEKEDYIFTGWNTQADGSGTAYANEGTAKFDKDTTLYAQWLEEVTITFNANDGSEAPETKTQKVGKGIATALDANTFEKSGFYFAHWNTHPDDKSSEYADGANITLESDLVLYAIWSDNPVITLNKGTGISEVTGSGSYAPGTEVTINATVADGYTWSKWTQTTGGADVSTTKEYSFTMGTENINYTANATANTYTVTLETNGGTIATGKDVTSYTYGVGATLPTASDITKSGNSFGGWYANSECTGDAVTSISTTDTGDKIFYAKWTDGAVVTFYKNDGVTPESTTTQTIPFNTETALTKNTFSRDYYVFVGWNTAKDGTGTAYSDEQKVTLTANLDLYAQWAIDLATTTLSKTSWTTGNVYSMSADVPISDRITVTGSVTLILPKDKTLTASKGITVSTGNTLKISGTGTLVANANGENNKAGIGGDGGDISNFNCGVVTINGGIVTATGGYNAAGIGGGDHGVGGTISISGGTVTANGGNNAAGIGGGNQGVGGEVTIAGGTVTATGGEFAAGIGGGNNGVGGEVTIAGGTVTATGGEYGGTGIGAGKYSSSHGTLKIGAGCALTGGSASADTLLLGPVNDETTYSGALHPKYMSASAVSEIQDSTTAVTLTSGAYTIKGDVSVDGRITVSGVVYLLLPDGKTLNAKKGITVASGNTLVIDKYGSTATGTGTLNATGENYNAGIGGEGVDGKRDAGTITIKAGDVTATGGSGGAGIGGGKQGNSGTITISTGTVNATGGDGGSGIGGGQRQYNTGGYGGTIIINGGTIIATGGATAGGAGIGGGYQGTSGIITISGGTITATGGSSIYNKAGGAGIGGGGNQTGDGGIINITGGSVTAAGGINCEIGIGAGGGSSNHGTLKIGTGLALYGDSSSPAHTKISDATDNYTGTRYRYMKAE